MKHMMDVVSKTERAVTISIPNYGELVGVIEETVADACECGNEPSGSVKCGEFLD